MNYSYLKAVLFLLLFSGCWQKLVGQSGTNWYDRSRYGLFVHYVPGLTVDARGHSTHDIDEVANRFNAQQLADDAETFGAEYLIFTSMHYRMRPLYPSAATEKWRPGNSSNRDVIRDLIEALKPKGIKLILYIHTTDGYDFGTEQERIATGFNDSTGHYQIWNDYVNELFQELGLRYGTDVVGYYQDMCMSKEYKNMIDKERLRKTLLAGNPSRILIGNGSTRYDGMDYTSKEYYPSGHMTTWRTFPFQIATVVGGEWWANTGQGKHAARLSAEQLYRFTILQSSVTNDGGMAWDAGTYMDGGWEDGVKEMFLGCAAYMQPVQAAVKGTLPSTSYPTPIGKSLSTIDHGMVATKSADDQYEFLHVLFPPANNQLVLPAPRDGKVFSKATLMNAGKKMKLKQDKNQLILTLPKDASWDSVNAVVRLHVADYNPMDRGVWVNSCDTLVKYHGQWETNSYRGKDDYRDDVTATRNNGDSFEFEFEGTRCDFIAPTGPGCGEVDLYVDGVFKGRINQDAHQYQPRQMVFSTGKLPDGRHVVKGVKVGGNYIHVDAFAVF